MLNIFLLVFLNLIRFFRLGVSLQSYFLIATGDDDGLKDGLVLAAIAFGGLSYSTILLGELEVIVELDGMFLSVFKETV